MKCDSAPFGFAATPPNGYNPAMLDSAPHETPPLFPRFLAGGPQELRLAPASVALLIGCGVVLQVASSRFWGWQTPDGWLVRSELAVAIIVGALLTALLATRWLGKPLGLAAGLLQLTCLYALGWPTELKPVESLVTVLVTAAMTLFARANIPGRLPVDTRLRMPVLFYGCAAGPLLLCRGWGELAGILLACLIHLLLNQDGRAFRFLLHPLGLGVAAMFSVYSLWLQHVGPPLPTAWPTAVPGWRWLATQAVGMFPWWPLCLVAVVAGCRRGDYATAFWRFAACWSLAPLVLAAAGLLGDRSALAMTCGPLSIFAAAGLFVAVRWWRGSARHGAGDGVHVKHEHPNNQARVGYASA